MRSGPASLPLAPFDLDRGVIRADAFRRGFARRESDACTPARRNDMSSRANARLPPRGHVRTMHTRSLLIGLMLTLALVVVPGVASATEETCSGSVSTNCEECTVVVWVVIKWCVLDVNPTYPI